MIIATMQSLRYGDESVASLDGKILDGEEKKQAEECFYFKVFKKKNIPEREGVYFLNENEVLCQIFHNQRDESGRKVFVHICYDYCDYENIMPKVAETMGFSYERFLEINAEGSVRLQIIFIFYKILRWIREWKHKCYKWYKNFYY